MIGTAEKVVDATDVNGREYKRIRINGCWYRSLDTEAGIRTYKKPRGFKFWHGYYNTKAIDHYTGAPLAIVVTSASRSEFHIYPELKESVKSTIGATPRSMVADKGFSVESVFQTNAKDKMLSARSFRQGRNKTRAEYATEEYDMHGIPKCKHCKHEGVFVSFTTVPKPRIIYRCSVSCPGSRNASGKPMRTYRYATIREEELATLRSAAPDAPWADAAALLDDLVLADDYAEFLTLEAYARLG